MVQVTKKTTKKVKHVSAFKLDKWLKSEFIICALAL